MKARGSARFRALGAVAALALTTLIPTLSGTTGASADAAPLAADPSSVAGGASIVLQALRCPTWGRVPANLPEVLIDETAGHWRSWGPAVPGQVTAYSESTLPLGCSFVDGVRFRLAADDNGFALVPGYAPYVPPGREDGEITAVVGPTGSDGSGQVVLGANDLSASQRQATRSLAAGGGLWVAADLTETSDVFANLRCHLDQRNADNREVIRLGPLDRAGVCVLYLVGGPSVSPTTSTTTPPTTTSVTVPPTTPLSTPVTATATTQTRTTQAPGAGGPTTTAGAPGGDANGQRPPSGASGSTGGAPTPIVSPPLGPHLSSPAAGTTDPAASPLAATGAPRPSTASPPPDIQGASKEVALERLTSMVLAVEVGGVTRGTPVGRPGGARSPWVRPIIIEVACQGDQLQRVEVPVGGVPGSQVVSEPLTLPAGAAGPCRVSPLSDGLAAGVASRNKFVSLLVDGSPLSLGETLEIEPEPGRDRTVLVNVTFGAAVADAAGFVDALPSPGDHPVPVPVAITLAATFVFGLAAAVARARRPW